MVLGWLTSPLDLRSLQDPATGEPSFRKIDRMELFVAWRLVQTVSLGNVSHLDILPYRTRLSSGAANQELRIRFP